jgi:hypothetical protein
VKLRETRWTILLDGAPMTREALFALNPGRDQLSNVQRICWDRVSRHEFDVARELPKSTALIVLLDVRRVVPTGHTLRLEPVLCELDPLTFQERVE